MNYHNITYPDMNNGDGLRVVLWLSGCTHHCKGCQNSQTWDFNSGIEFDVNAENELFDELKKDYISGITFTGGDPLHEKNINKVYDLINRIRHLFPNKSIWLYTGYIINVNNGIFKCKPSSNNTNDSLRSKIIQECDVVIDGQYIEAQRDVMLKWRGSLNQRVIDIQSSLKKGTIILWTD